MILLFPSTIFRKRLAVLDTKVLWGGYLNLYKSDLPIIKKIRNLLPDRIAVINGSIRIMQSYARMYRGRPEIRTISVGEARNLILRRFLPLLQILPRLTSPRSLFERIRMLEKGYREYIVVTRKRLYCTGEEPSQIRVSYFLALNKILWMIT